ncbi:MAG TPA: serine/threonine-protein kinase [Pyrinomonadaceae bacterium]|nr:serine/threonine-protein kinase [Pyrinomonadaceae bacterium]
MTACPEDGAALVADATVPSAVTGDPADPLVGRVLDDKYRLDARLGEGGMGTVYSATHLLIERSVAVKVLNPRLLTDEAAKERFRREARAAGRLQHSNAVAVTDFGETRDGVVYLVMELLEGRPLRDLLAHESPLDPARAVSIMLQVAAAVGAAHEAGIIHRDLKPGNIFVVQRPNAPHIVKVLDFGIAKLAPTEGDGVPLNTLTGTGVMIGTPRYMSPEQCDGAQLTPAADVYSLGVILYEMLTGQTPFTGATPLALALKHSSEQPRPLREIVPGVPPALEDVVLHTLAKSPEERPADAGEFRRELFEAAERLGLEHQAGFSAPTIETLRDAGTETPSGRLVIDIERLRRNRAAQTTELGSTTDEEQALQTSGRPGQAKPAEPPADEQPAAPQLTVPVTPRAAVEESRPARVGVPARPGRASWKYRLTHPLAFVVILSAALLLIFGALQFRRSAPGAKPSAKADESDALGRTLTDTTQTIAPPVAQPRTAADFYDSGTYNFSIRDYDSAVRDFRRAVELQPEFPSARNRLGRALMMKGQFSAAAEEFRKAVEQQGGNFPVAQYNLGFALQRQNDAEGALAAYRKAIESRGGDYPDAFFQIGTILMDLKGREAEAADALRKAAEQNGGRDPEAQLRLGVLLARQQDYQGAESAFRAAADSRGDFPYAHYNLALLYERTARLPEAVQEYEKFLEKAPRDDPNRRAAENSLRDLRRRVERGGGRQ